MKTEIASLINQASKLHQQGKLEKARLTYQEALNMEPDNFDALIGLGKLYEQLGQFEEALPLIEKASEIQTSNFTSLLDQWQDASRFEIL